MLTHDEAARLRRLAPAELDRRALEERADFVFAVKDLRSSLGVTWGGEVRALLNQNVIVHLVPRYNDEMRTVDELPEFCIFPDDARDGEDRTHTYEAVKDLDSFDGVVFYVSTEQYRRMLAELADAAARYGDWLRIPDTLYAATEFVRVARRRVLEHSLVRAERKYDFSKRTF